MLLISSMCLRFISTISCLSALFSFTNSASSLMCSSLAIFNETMFSACTHVTPRLFRFQRTCFDRTTRKFNATTITAHLDLREMHVLFVHQQFQLLFVHFDFVLVLFLDVFDFSVFISLSCVYLKTKII